MAVHEASVKDARAFIELYNHLDTETKFMLFEPGERDTSLERQEKILGDIIESENRILLVSESESRLVGFAGGFGGAFQRNKHSLRIVLGIVREYWRKGIGTELMGELEAWAREKGYHRLELTANEHNHGARTLYQKLGFVEEGVKRHSLKIDGQYVDEVCMSKLLGPNP